MIHRRASTVLTALLAGGVSLAAPAPTPQAVFARYVLNPPSQVSDLTVSGLDAGRPTLSFILAGALKLPADPRFVRRSYAEAYAAALNTPCKSALNGSSRLKLERLAVTDADAGRLTVQNGARYCLSLWNFKR